MRAELRPGTVTLVGGGPGDPDLLTVAAVRALGQADVVVHDRLVPQAALAHVRPDAEIVPVGKVPRGPQTTQAEINGILVDRARRGLRVVRFKGGDPFVFGRGGEEALACAEAGIDVSVIPGVTSSVAAPALAGIPVTHRQLSQGFTVVTGHVPPDDPRCTVDWDVLARARTTLVILMGVQNIAPIAARLRAAGLPPQTPALVVASAATPDMTVARGTLADIAEVVARTGVGPPAIIVVGEVAGLDLGVASPAGDRAGLATGASLVPDPSA